MDKINQCFTLSLATSSIFFSPGYVISGLSTRDACMVWEKNNKRVRDKKCTALSHILLPRPIAILKKINKITRSAMVAHSLKDNTTSVTLSIEHQPSSAVVVVINSCVYWNLLTCYWAPIIQWKLCNVVPALFAPTSQWQHAFKIAIRPRRGPRFLVVYLSEKKLEKNWKFHFETTVYSWAS